MKKTAIVTGASRGIGFAIARRLGLDGCQVVLFATGAPDKYREGFDLLEKDGVSYHYVRGDVSLQPDREALIEETVHRFGRVDILVNNAGVAPRIRQDLLEMTEESYNHVMDINLKGPLFLTQMVAKRMIQQEKAFESRGRIVNIGSCSAEVSSISRGEYCISKAGVSMLTRLFADRLAGDDIFVNEVRPGVISTDMTAVVREKYDKLIQEGVFPIARWGTDEDVARMVSFFCSEQVGYTTGSYVDVDGGFHIRRL